MRFGLKTCAALAVCAATPLHAEAIDVAGWYPAGAREVGQFRTIGVDRFDGQDGPALALAIERVLGSVDGSDGRPHFSVIALLRNSAEPDGVVSGIAETSVNVTRYKKTEKQCPDGPDAKCEKAQKVDVEINCRRRTIDLTASIRVVRTADQRIVYSGDHPRNDTTSWCADGSPPADPGVPIRRMIASIADEFARVAAPHYEKNRIRFREDVKAMSKPEVAEFKRALRATKSNMDEACGIWEAMEEARPGYPSVVFNLGLCADAAGKLDTARAYYGGVSQSGPRPARDVEEGIARVLDRKAALEDAEARNVSNPETRKP